MDSPSPEAPASPERVDPNATPSVTSEGIARRRLRVTVRMLGSVLLGGVAILGSVLVFRQGFLPLVDAAFHPGPEWLSAFRRAGILLSALVGYWAYVHWHEKREVTELRLLVIVPVTVAVTLLLRAARQRRTFHAPAG